jgi:uncharacterized protein DUF2844
MPDRAIFELVSLRWSCALLALAFLAVSPAFATLGEDVSSVASDQARMKASVRVVPRQFYSVHEMQTPSGTTVRQFVSPAGTVFAISWQGFSPDLHQLLGRYFDEYMTAAASTPSGRHGRGLHIETGDLVFDSGGYMRFVTGRAYLRSKTPEAVSSNDIH